MSTTAPAPYDQDNQGDGVVCYLIGRDIQKGQELTGKQWTARWLGLVAVVVTTTTGAFALAEHAESVVEAFSPVYVPLSIEEKFRRAELPCKPPSGSSSGCQTIAELSPAASGWDRSNNDSDIRIEFLSLLLEEQKNRETYVERELKPKVEILKLGLALAYALHLLGVAMYAIPLLLVGVESRRNQGTSSWVRRVAQLAPLRQLARDALRTRKLRQAHVEFKVLKELYDNGLITEAVFLQKKEDMKDRLTTGGAAS